LELSHKSAIFDRLLPVELQRSLTAKLGRLPVGSTIEIPKISFDWTSQALIELDEELAQPEKYATLPTSVQQNVPAWTLFGMFFIVIPLAGTRYPPSRNLDSGAARRNLDPLDDDASEYQQFVIG